MTIHFVPNDKGLPPGKLADAELHFDDGPLDGLKLVGFSVWERRGGGLNVTFPARQYSVNGERRSFALLRPVVDARSQDRLRDEILTAWRAFRDAAECAAQDVADQNTAAVFAQILAPQDVPLPTLAVVRSTENAHPPIAAVPRADPANFSLRAQSVTASPVKLF